MTPKTPAEQFLGVLHPVELSTPGEIVLWSKRGEEKISAWFSPADHRRLTVQAERWAGDGRDVYLTCCTHDRETAAYKAKTDDPTSFRGCIESAAALVALWADIDTAGGNHASKDPPTAEQARARLAELPLSPSIIVASGGGFHLWWLLSEPEVFHDSAERQRAAAIIKAWARLVGGDLAAADLARVLRLPGTTSFKYSPPRPVSMLECHPDRRYHLPDIEDLLDAAGLDVGQDGPPPRRAGEGERPAPDATLIADACPWFRHARDDAATLPEPEWYAALSILGRCENGVDLAHVWSKPHPDYRPDKTDAKLAHAIKDTGPATCRRIRELTDGRWCGSCPHRSAPVRFSPVILGRSVAERSSRVAGATPYEIRTVAGVAGVADPTPLISPLPAAPEFPIDHLPDIIRQAILGLQARTQGPVALCAQSVLAAATLATQAQADVDISAIGTRPLSCFFVTLARSGERKSSADRLALLAVRQMEDRLRLVFQGDMQEFENQVALYNRDRDAILKSKKIQNRRLELDALGEPPRAPLLPRLLVSEPTIEGLLRLLDTGLPSVGLFNDEGGTLLGGYGFTKDHRLKTVANLNRLWDGATVDKTRGSEGCTVLAGRRVALHIMIQPDVANELLTERIIQGSGFASRLLITQPDSTIGTRLHRDPPAWTEMAIGYFNRRVEELLERPLPLAPAARNELLPPTLPLDQDANDLWIRFHDAIETDLPKQLEPITEFAAKVPEHAARLAAVLTVFENPDAKELPASHMAMGIELAGYYVKEALRLTGVRQASVTDTRIEKARKWILREWPHNMISIRDFCQLGPDQLRTPAAFVREKVFPVLMANGWLRPAGAGPVNGVTRKERWEVCRDGGQ